MGLRPHIDYYYDLTGMRAYVLVDVPFYDDVINIIDYLKINDIECTGSGASKYPARSGKKYAWFIRVEDKFTGEKPPSGRIHPLLQRFDTGESLNLKLQQSQDFYRNLEILAQAQPKAEAHLAKHETELENIRQKNEQLITKEATTSLALEELEKRYKQLDEERQKLTLDSRNKGELANYVSEEHDKLNRESEVIKQKNVSLITERDELIQKLMDYKESKTRQLSSIVDDGKSSERDMFQLLLPNVKLLQDSAELMFERVDTQPVIKRIRQIVFGKQNGDVVRGASEWREMRFSTGQDDSGRIYYRIMGNDMYEILVSWKENQEKDIKYLKNR